MVTKFLRKLFLQERNFRIYIFFVPKPIFVLRIHFRVISKSAYLVTYFQKTGQFH